MKFEQAIKEGFSNYVSQDEESLDVGKDILQLVHNIVNDRGIQQYAASQVDENPELFKAVQRVYFSIDDLIQNGNKLPAEDGEEFDDQQNAKADLDDTIEREARRNPNAAHEMKRRQGAVEAGLKKYKDTTDDIIRQVKEKLWKYLANFTN